MKLRTTLTAAALSLFAFGAFAQTAASAPMPGADARQAKQEARIEKGAQSGALTSKETKALDAQQNRVGRMEKRAEADGTVTKGEKAHVAHAQNKANRSIRHQKHDAQASAPTGKQ